jgi:hypothetical protein
VTGNITKERRALSPSLMYKMRRTRPQRKQLLPTLLYITSKEKYVSDNTTKQRREFFLLKIKSVFVQTKLNAIYDTELHVSTYLRSSTCSQLGFKHIKKEICLP